MVVPQRIPRIISVCGRPNAAPIARGLLGPLGLPGRGGRYRPPRSPDAVVGWCDHRRRSQWANTRAASSYRCSQGSRRLKTQSEDLAPTLGIKRLPVSSLAPCTSRTPYTTTLFVTVTYVRLLRCLTRVSSKTDAPVSSVSHSEASLAVLASRDEYDQIDTEGYRYADRLSGRSRSHRIFTTAVVRRLHHRPRDSQTVIAGLTARTLM